MINDTVSTYQSFPWLRLCVYIYRAAKAVLLGFMVCNAFSYVGQDRDENFPSLAFALSLQAQMSRGSLVCSLA